MLKEIYSSVIKQKTIKFHKGLNVVLGDNNASNSIGKSTMLLIIDYVFGGDTYIKVMLLIILDNMKFAFVWNLTGSCSISKEKPNKVKQYS